MNIFLKVKVLSVLQIKRSFASIQKSVLKPEKHVLILVLQKVAQLVITLIQKQLQVRPMEQTNSL